MSAPISFAAFDRSLPARGREPGVFAATPFAAPGGGRVSRLGRLAALGGDRRLHGTPFDAQ